MEILERKKRQTWTMDTECKGGVTDANNIPGRPGCGSVFRVVVEDLKKIVVHSTGGTYQGEFATYKCPIEDCGVTNDIPSGIIPAWVFALMQRGTDRGKACSSFGDR